MAFVRFKLVTDRKEQILTFWWRTVEGFLRSHVGFNTFRSQNFVCDMQKRDVFTVLWDVMLCVLAQTVRRSEELCCSGTNCTAVGRTVLFWYKLYGGRRNHVVLVQTVRRSDEPCCSGTNCTAVGGTVLFWHKLCGGRRNRVVLAQTVRRSEEPCCSGTNCAAVGGTVLFWHKLCGGRRNRVVLARTVRRSEEPCCSHFQSRREVLVQYFSRIYGVTFNSSMILA
jgi:hypothetical protein